ncbi:conserved hypothetical protein [Azospirillaceae bacterium]
MDEKLKTFWNKLNSGLGNLWEKDKIFLIVFGVLILVVKFRSLLIDLIASDAKNIFNKAKQVDSTLAKQEDNYKESAKKLVKEANRTKNSDPVSEDWNKS